MDPLEAVFVFCFVFGVATSLLSLALGALHGADGGHALGGDHGGGLHLGGEGAGGHGGEALVAGDAGGDLAAAEGGDAHAGHVSPLNLQTITAFLAFFGGVGWVLYGSVGLAPALALIAATIAGVIGGGVVFVFLVKVLVAGQRFMDPSLSQMEGTVAQVSIPIRAGGTGEIVYAREGVRHSEGARSASGQAIDAGTEVVVVRYERGLAYVEPWTSYTGED